MTKTEQKKLNINSRWRKGAQRYRSDRTVEHRRSVRQPGGFRRKTTDSPSETVFVARLREADGWRKGARVSKIGETK